jgi:2-phosphosulfolactate phosphatase
MSAPGGVFTIACFHEHLRDDAGASAIVAIDVLRATTTAITAVVRGRRCFPAASIEAAVPLAARLDNPLLAGELGGMMPYGFHIQNTPALIDELDGPQRPVVLLSTSGTRLMSEAAARPGATAYAACLRNAAAQARCLAGRHDSVRLLGADSRTEFREEDQLCCARIGAALAEAGFEPGDKLTEQVLERWAGAPDNVVESGRSAAYLRQTGQERDLEFVLSHVDDLDAVFELRGGELVMQEVA